MLPLIIGGVALGIGGLYYLSKSEGSSNQSGSADTQAQALAEAQANQDANAADAQAQADANDAANALLNANLPITPATPIVPGLPVSPAVLPAILPVVPPDITPPDATAQMARVTTTQPSPAGDLNIRSGPTTSAPIIGTAAKDSLIQVLEWNSATADGYNWAHVQSMNTGADGYAAQNYLVMQDSTMTGERVKHFLYSKV